MSRSGVPLQLQLVFCLYIPACSVPKPIYYSNGCIMYVPVSNAFSPRWISFTAPLPVAPPPPRRIPGSTSHTQPVP